MQVLSLESSHLLDTPIEGHTGQLNEVEVVFGLVLVGNMDLPQPSSRFDITPEIRDEGAHAGNSRLRFA